MEPLHLGRPPPDRRLEPHEVPVGILHEELPHARLLVADPVPGGLRLEEERHARRGERLRHDVDVLDGDLEVDPRPNGRSSGPVTQFRVMPVCSSMRCAPPRAMYAKPSAGRS